MDAIRPRIEQEMVAVADVSSPGASPPHAFGGLHLTAVSRPRRSVAPPNRQHARIEHNAAANHRQHGSSVEDLARRDLEDIARQDHQIRETAGFQTALSMLSELGVRRAARVTLDGLRQRDALLRE